MIEDDYFFIDLVFYHRILQCHVLVEIKVDEFKHKYIGQLNAYLEYYKENVMTANDNPLTSTMRHLTQISPKIPFQTMVLSPCACRSIALF